MIRSTNGILISFMLPALLSWQKGNSQDSLEVLGDIAFINMVRTHHPVARQGALLVDQAKARLLATRGEFDAGISYYIDQKTFDGKEYFNYNQGNILIPTWFGIELQAGIENNFGDLVNRETTVGRNSYAGISFPLLKELVIDKRRAVLQQAKLFSRQSEYDRRIIINDLLLAAYTSYWNWARDHQVLQVIENTVRINEQRNRMVLVSFEQGDRAAVDTTESLAQLQSFIQLREEAWLKYRKSTLELSNYLWLPGDQPADLPENVIPDTTWTNQDFDTVNIAGLESWLSQAREGHPKLRGLDLKINSLKIERRLKFQSLLPGLDIKYNVLQKGYNPFKGANQVFFENNYKFGLKATLPIPNRSGLGGFREARIKFKSAEMELALQQLSVENKIRYHYAEVLNVRRQISVYQQAYDNYLRLLEAEQLKFTLGETTIFLLNTRESKVLEARQKLLELKMKFFQSLASLNWASGQLP